MHELSLIEGVLGMVRDSAEQNNISTVNKVKLVVGKFSMALPDSLRFAFEALAGAEKLFQDAVLEIEEREITCQCLQCGQTFQLEEAYCFVCSGCGSGKVEIIAGRELYLDYYEGDDN